MLRGWIIRRVGAFSIFRVPVVFAVVEENFFAWFDLAKGFETGGLPSIGNDQESVRFIGVIDVAGVIRLGPFTENNVRAANPEHIRRGGPVGIEKLLFGHDLAGVVTDGVFESDPLFRK